MYVDGIYTLANDMVYDQLVALLNSIEANVSPDIPVCIIPYDEQIDKVQKEVGSRENVTIYENWDSIQRWETFARDVWAVHPTAKQKGAICDRGKPLHLHRKLVTFDGQFNRFVFYDADTLAMQPLEKIFAALEKNDFVFDDWEHKKPKSVAALNLDVIESSNNYQGVNLREKLHCSSFFASKRGIFNENELAELKHRLIQEGEVKWINNRYCDDAFLFNYLTLRSDRPLFNFTLSPNSQDRTGNCADADPFVNLDNVLHNEEGLKPIHRIHYMNYTSADFARLSQGENVDIRYKDIFLYYRFLKEPERRPQELIAPTVFQKTSRMMQKVMARIKRKCQPPIAKIIGE